MNRNTWLGIALGIVSFCLANASASAQFEPITLNWLEGPPQVASGVSWGVPWPQGKVKKDQTFQLTGADGTARPLQSWPLAYWPDGSMKWIGFATVVTPQMAGPFKLTAGAGAAADGPKVQVKTTKQTIEIDTGGIICKIPAQGGPDLFEAIVIRGRTVAANGRLECISQIGPDVDPALPPPREKFVSNIKKVTVEQSGPVRAVVKFEGMHQSTTTKREWLPFTVRLYFSAGDTPVRMVHTFFFDGDEKKDFIRGLGVTFSVPFAEEIQNRHVRLSGEDAGLWAEPIQPLTGYQRSITYPGGGQVYNDQIAGKRMPNRKDLSAANQQTLDAFAMWDNYRLIQPNAQGFTIEKQTGPKSSWVIAGAGKRSTGYAFVGDVSGGLGVGAKDFWQSYPASLEVRQARSKAADLRVWLWSPDAPAMDMRHYDTIAHGLNETYEDVEEGFSTPLGIARTSCLTLFPKGGLPTKQETARQVQTAVKPPLLVCTPKYLHSVKAFGLWSLQDRSTDFKKGIEDILDSNIAFFQKEIEQRNWYGFWDYGDVMHGYDSTRHVWKYDIGGFAWDNSEQGTDMWLWYSFLRTGRADIFRMAEAMTRHTGEVDCAHFGKFAGLGSRHNVRHWGDGAKEARISMAGYRRFYYYLTTDERTGDQMREMLVADFTVAAIDSMRKALPRNAADKKFPGRLRAGPDWFALLSNWMTEWERTGETKYRDKMFTGMDSIAEMPYWLRTGPSLVMGYYPETGKLVARTQTLGSYNLVTNMGGPEVIAELNEYIDHPTWKKIWLQYCRLSGAPANVITQDMKTGNEGSNGQYAGGGRMAGYAYYVTKNPAFAQKAMGAFPAGGGGKGQQKPKILQGPDVLNTIEESRTGLITNNVVQSSLQMIEVLELCKDKLPEKAGKGGGKGK